VVLEARVHLAPPNGDAGHFNVLRGHLGPEHVSAVKVVDVMDKVVVDD
jgi:hypothetical protein